jgi:hypothetical protein
VSLARGKKAHHPSGGWFEKGKRIRVVLCIKPGQAGIRGQAGVRACFLTFSHGFHIRAAHQERREFNSPGAIYRPVASTGLPKLRFYGSTEER